LLDISLTPLLTNIWFLALLVLFIIPMLQKYTLEATRGRLLSKIGDNRNSAVMTLIHRQETLSLLGAPIARYIDIDDSEEVLRAIRTTPKNVPIDLILHTPGGLALKAHPAEKRVIIPHYAMSGGTLIALAADKIIMDPHAALGPVDPQFADQKGAYAAVSLVKLIEKKKPSELDDDTLVMIDQAEKALRQMDDLVRTILKDNCEPGKIEEIISHLVSGRYTHDHPFMAEDARWLLGDRLNTDVPPEVYELMQLYRMEVGRKRPGVGYVGRT
jgi:ClpP class serine protease